MRNVIEIELPTGEVVEFPANVPDSVIVETLAREFAAAPPTSLAPGEQHMRPNGATITYCDRIDRYRVTDSTGRACGYRQDLTGAIDLADALPSPPEPRKTPNAPKPEPRIDPIAADRQFRTNVEEAIRQQASRERFARREEHRRRLGRNRGTL
jgi:hypothetical protein